MSSALCSALCCNHGHRHPLSTSLKQRSSCPPRYAATQLAHQQPGVKCYDMLTNVRVLPPAAPAQRRPATPTRMTMPTAAALPNAAAQLQWTQLVALWLVGKALPSFRRLPQPAPRQRACQRAPQSASAYDAWRRTAARYGSGRQLARWQWHCITTCIRACRVVTQRKI